MRYTLYKAQRKVCLLHGHALHAIILGPMKAKIIGKAECFALTTIALKLFCMYSHQLPQDLFQMCLNIHATQL